MGQTAAVARVVEAAAAKGVAIEVVTFAESTRTAVEAAQAVGAEVGQIVKSLVFMAEPPAGKAILALVSGTNRVELGLLANAVGAPKVRRATADEAYAATCFAIGGVPPVGHCHELTVVMDPDLLQYDLVWAAAGSGNAVFPIAPAVLRELAGAALAPIGERPAETVQR